MPQAFAWLFLFISPHLTTPSASTEPQMPDSETDSRCIYRLSTLLRNMADKDVPMKLPERNIPQAG